jgi:hypothetical protein
MEKYYMNDSVRTVEYSIAIAELEDDTLVDLFRELIQKNKGKDILRMIILTLLKRKKLYLLTKGM